MEYETLVNDMIYPYTKYVTVPNHAVDVVVAVDGHQ